MKNKILLLFLIIGPVRNINAQTIFMQETFGGYTIPSGWIQDSAGINPIVSKWIFNTGGTVTGIGFDSSYIRVSPYLVASGEYTLTSPAFSTIGSNTAYLSYCEYSYGGAGIGFMKTEISNDGIIWHEVFNIVGNFNTSQISWRKVVDISQYASNQTNVYVRFHHNTGNGFGSWALDSIVVSDVADCSSPADPKGITVNDRDYLCSGTITNLQIVNLSRGIGQTYQWQVKNPSNGNVFTDISGAVFDTLHYAQNGFSHYRCVLTCNSSTATTKELQMPDFPADMTELNSTSGVGICSAKDDTLYLQSTNHHLGVGFQWMDNDSATGVYTDISGATDTFYVVKASNYSADAYFKCKEVCASSGLYRASDVWVDYVNLNPYCYCEPYTFNQCSQLPSPTIGGLLNVSIPGTSFNNTSGPCINQMGLYNNYSFFSPTIPTNTATLTMGATYNLSVTQDTAGLEMVGIWIDYDHNQLFDSTEYTLIVPWPPPVVATYVAPFTVPANATPGLTGMRVRCTGNFTDLRPERACSYLFFGETEDYMITIDTATAITELTVQNGLQLLVYPNPVSGRQQLTVAVGGKQANTVEILTMQGSVVLKENFTGNTFTTQSTFAPGVYAVKVNTGGEVLQKRLVVVK